MAALLQQVKGGGQGQAISKSEVAAAADNILGPLMDLLDGNILLFSQESREWLFSIALSLLPLIFNYCSVEKSFKSCSVIVKFHYFKKIFVKTMKINSVIRNWILFLLGSLSMYAENCDKSVLKRLLKQLWRIVMKSLERNIVLPPIETKVEIFNLLSNVFSFLWFSAKGPWERSW